MKLAIPVIDENLQLSKRAEQSPYFAIFINDEFQMLRENLHARRLEEEKNDIETWRKDLINLADVDTFIFRSIGPVMKEALELEHIEAVKVPRNAGDEASRVVLNYLTLLERMTEAPPEKKERRILFATEENAGYLSKRSPHFDQAHFYTLVTLVEGRIVDVESKENLQHTATDFGSAVMNVLTMRPDVMIVSGIDNNSANVFSNAGIELYFDPDAPTVVKSVEKLAAGKLEKLDKLRNDR